MTRRSSITLIAVLAALGLCACELVGPSELARPPRRWVQVCTITWYPPPGYTCELRHCAVRRDGSLDCDNQAPIPCAYDPATGTTCPVAPQPSREPDHDP